MDSFGRVIPQKERGDDYGDRVERDRGDAEESRDRGNEWDATTSSSVSATAVVATSTVRKSNSGEQQPPPPPPVPPRGTDRDHFRGSGGGRGSGNGDFDRRRSSGGGGGGGGGGGPDHRGPGRGPPTHHDHSNFHYNSSRGSGGGSSTSSLPYRDNLRDGGRGDVSRDLGRDSRDNWQGGGNFRGGRGGGNPHDRDLPPPHGGLTSRHRYLSKSSRSLPLVLSLFSLPFCPSLSFSSSRSLSRSSHDSVQ